MKNQTQKNHSKTSKKYLTNSYSTYSEKEKVVFEDEYICS
jgi:hypothetical protein